MISRLAISKPHPLPIVLKYNDIRSYIFTGVFAISSVTLPRVFHQFHLAGPTFLPMHIFVLTAGLLFGGRAGLIVGLLTPLTSYAISGMPAPAILPQIIIELSVYGLAAGILRERFHLRPVWSLLGAMAAGRLALYLAALVIHQLAGSANSPLGLEANPFLVVGSAIKQGWPGIVIQLSFVPVAIWLTGKLTARTLRDRTH
ncbi:ECF transporter S component [Chloroflexota bacterium]